MFSFPCRGKRGRHLGFFLNIHWPPVENTTRSWNKFLSVRALPSAHETKHPRTPLNLAAVFEIRDIKTLKSLKKGDFLNRPLALRNVREPYSYAQHDI